MVMRLVKLRLRYLAAGAHVQCRLFIAPAEVKHPTWEVCGSLTFRADEWVSVRAQLEETMQIVED